MGYKEFKKTEIAKTPTAWKVVRLLFLDAIKQKCKVKKELWNWNMTEILRIDRALYEVDDETRTYWYFGRNSNWEKLSEEENRSNKKHIDGYTRTFPDGRRKVFRYRK